WAESKNNPTQQEDAKTSSRFKSEIKEKKTTRFIKKDENRTRRKTLDVENEERSGYSKNKSLNATLQEILNRLEKIESSYSSSRAIATPDTGRVHEKTQGTHSLGAEGTRKIKTSEDYQVLKLDYIWISKEWAAYIIQASTKDMDLVTNNKEISMDKEWDIIQSSIIKAAQTSLPMKKKLEEILKTEDTRKTDVLQLLRKRIRKLGIFRRRMRKRVLMPQEEKELYELCKDIEKNYEIDTSCEQTQDTEEKRCNLENI
ncbi:26384_t:CDS:2, partial [Gigaspora margarita]